MQTCFLDGVASFHLPLRGDGALALGRVADHRDSLLDAERDEAAGMGAVRLATFSSGRRVAREALRCLDIHDWPILRQGRLPCWPPVIVGAIAHSRGLACALAVRTEDCRGVGVDIETERRVGARLAVRLLTQEERENRPGPLWRTALFSAKEAVYKAVNPLIGEYLGFQDVAIALDGNAFAARTTRPCASTSAVAAGEGMVLQTNGHWLAIFTLPA